uniref:Uncharacterized protein n=1 Tax=Schistocephalus solidus TaxID=70667 RepID=A0A0X3PD95_SCHSO
MRPSCLRLSSFKQWECQEKSDGLLWAVVIAFLASSSSSSFSAFTCLISEVFRQEKWFLLHGAQKYFMTTAFQITSTVRPSISTRSTVCSTLGGAGTVTCA